MQNPLGPYGNLVAAIVALAVILAAVASHLVSGLVPSDFLDNLGLLAAGVVFGTQVVQNGTQVKASEALAAAGKANRRLDVIAAPALEAARASDRGDELP